MHVQLILVPFDTGRRDWRMGGGPARLVEAGLPDFLKSRGHAVDSDLLAPQPAGEIRTSFDLMALVAQHVRAARARDRFPLVLAGNCSTAAGTIAGLGAAAPAVFWFDAHGDCNTPESTTSGFLDGMSLAIAMGWCWRGLAAAIPGWSPVAPGRVTLLGVRDLDAPEAELVARAGMATLSPAALRATGLAGTIARVPAGADAGYIHCDLDVLDPSEGRANPFAVGGGLTVTEVRDTIRGLGAAVPVRAAALTAYAPECDDANRVPSAACRIVEAILDTAARAPATQGNRNTSA